MLRPCRPSYVALSLPHRQANEPPPVDLYRWTCSSVARILFTDLQHARGLQGDGYTRDGGLYVRHIRLLENRGAKHGIDGTRHRWL